MATNRPIHPQFVAQYNHQTNPIRPSYRIHAMNQGKPTNDKHTRNRTLNSPSKDPSRPCPDCHQTHPGHDTKIRRTKEGTMPFLTIRRRTTSMAGRNKPLPVTPNCQIAPQTLWTFPNYQGHQSLHLPHQAASSLEDTRCLPRFALIPLH
jgi:hypothetical protein